MKKFKVVREVKVDKFHFKVGDRITVPIRYYGIFTATCQYTDPFGSIFMFDECIETVSMDKILDRAAIEPGYIDSVFRLFIQYMDKSYFTERGVDVVYDFPSIGNIFTSSVISEIDSRLTHVKYPKFVNMQSPEDRVRRYQGTLIRYWLREYRPINGETHVSIINTSGMHDTTTDREDKLGICPVFTITKTYNKEVLIR